MTPTPTLGFIGTGLMGGPMAARLLDAGVALTVWNRTRAKLDPLLARAATAAESPADLSRRSDVVLMCLTDARAVEAVVHGPGGLAEGTAGLVIDHSSISPDATRDIAARLKARTGAGWVDAPVSGGVRGAEAGTLAIMAGGRAGDIETARAIVAPLCDRFTAMGDVGAGQVTKLCNQIIVSATMVVAAEATDFARRAGVEPGRLTEALAGGFADSAPFRIFQPRMAAHLFEPKLGAACTLLKDVEAARALGAAHAAAMPVSDIIANIMRALMDKGHGDDDIATLITLYEDGGLPVG